jgi:hypothetical protein
VYEESYAKIRSCGEQTRRDGLQHFWVDTCCINKDSIAELSQAINSMYSWYRRAHVWYAYLDDIHKEEDLGRSRWFTQGWTLQELLAPADVVFFNRLWSPIRFKSSLTRILSRCTGVDEDAHHHGDDFG